MGLVALWHVKSLLLPVRVQTHIPCTGIQILNHWTTREVPMSFSVCFWGITDLEHCVSSQVHNIIIQYFCPLQNNYYGESSYCLSLYKDLCLLAGGPSINKLEGGFQNVTCQHWCPCSRICCCCSVTKSCLTLCNPMDCSTPGFPVPCSRMSSPKWLLSASVSPRWVPVASCRSWRFSKISKWVWTRHFSNCFCSGSRKMWWPLSSPRSKPH